MRESRTIDIFIDRPWREVYEAIWRPEDFSRWASGLSRSTLTRDGDAWRAEGPDGAVTIRFTDHNPFGVMDHVVETGSGRDIQVPLRIVANGDGAQVMLTLFRQAAMSDETFAADIAWVERDLRTLKALVTG